MKKTKPEISDTEIVIPNTQYQITEIVVVPVSEEYPKGLKFENLGYSDAMNIINYLLGVGDMMIGYKLARKRKGR